MLVRSLNLSVRSVWFHFAWVSYVAGGDGLNFV